MTTSLDVTLVGGVLSHEVRSGKAKATGNPYVITEVTLLTPTLDKVVVSWPDGEQRPADGAGVMIKARVSSRAGVATLDVRCKSWREHAVSGVLAAAMAEVVEADVVQFDDAESVNTSTGELAGV